MEFDEKVKLKEIFFAMDASRNPELGFGGHCRDEWMQCGWDGFIQRCNPSIEYLELYTLVAGVLAWLHQYRNKFVMIYMDNQTMKAIVNNTSSSCKNCMILVRILVMHCLKYNVKIKAKYIWSKRKKIADSLSWFQEKGFRRLMKKYQLSDHPTEVPWELWPIQKLWIFWINGKCE